MIFNLIISALLAGSVTVEARLPAGTVLESIHLSGSPSEVAPLIGRQITRSAYPGREITLADTREADLVSRNAIVRIVARKGPLRVETKGRSLGAGPAGAEVMVMNMESRRTIAARVVGPGIVEVDL